MPLPRPFQATCLVTLALFGGALSPLAGQQATAGTVPAWVQIDSGGRRVALALETTPAGNAPSAAINGYREGGVQVILPLGWTVAWDWRSTDSTARHSLVVMAEREKLPTEGGRPAFINAVTRMPTEGLRPGEPDRTSFEADQPGWYWLLCGVPGHALQGEWIGIRVDPEVSTVTVKEAGR